MSRLSTAPQRSLSLPEELEKLEQSITLTLQGLPPDSIEINMYVDQCAPQKSTTTSAVPTRPSRRQSCPSSSNMRSTRRLYGKAPRYQ